MHSNSHPDFKTPIEKEYVVGVNETLEYRLPDLVDKEGNDESEMIIRAYDNKPYPPFLSYANHSRTMFFRPYSVWYTGQTYYFQILVKEKNSDSVSFIYFCSVKVGGEVIDPMKFLTFEDITYRISEITSNSTGAMVWSHDVNLTFVKENWDSMF